MFGMVLKTPLIREYLNKQKFHLGLFTHLNKF